MRPLILAATCSLLLAWPPTGAPACSDFCLDTPDGPVFGASGKTAVDLVQIFESFECAG